MAESDSKVKYSIQIKELIKIYKRKEVETSALRGLSLKIRKGKITVLMGPSGCGKTTLLNIIGGISYPSAGKVIVEDNNISSFSEKNLEKYRRDTISYIFQQMNLIPSMKVKDNISFSLEYTNNYDEESQERIKEIVKFIEIEDKLDHYPDELSGGEQQRVALAAALAKNSSIILCDEPTGELDSESKVKVMEILKMINKKYPDKTIIIVSHDPDFKLIADSVFFMRDGKISFEESQEKLQALQRGEMGTPSTHTISSLQQPENANAVQELRELARAINDRLMELEQKQDKRDKIDLEGKL
ncbi:MAG: ABC transporter ATP-binding protein [Promethearchaeota archaeon]